MPNLNIILPEHMRFIRWVYLNKPMEVETEDGMKISYKATKIGRMCEYTKTGEIVYHTYRHGSEHFLWSKNSMGIDVALVMRYLSEYQKNMSFGIGKQDLKVVFFYDGVREHRYYYLTLDELKRKAVEDGFASDRSGIIMTHGQQLFVRLEDFHILGYAQNDCAVLKQKEAMTVWAGFASR